MLYFQSPAVNGQVGLLSSGLEGANVLAVFSTALVGTFIAERTFPATAIIFTEAEGDSLSSKQSSHSHSSSNSKPSCPRTPLTKVKRTIQPVLNKLSKITKPVSEVKSKIYQKLGIRCLFPKLLRPFEPIIEKVTCKLGLDEDSVEANGFMRMTSTNCSSCSEPSSEIKQVTRSLGIMEEIDEILENEVSTLDDCFDDMKKVTYGSRVVAKLVDDVSCDDPRYEGICEELMIQGRVIDEDNCQSEG